MVNLRESLDIWLGLLFTSIFLVFTILTMRRRARTLLLAGSRRLLILLTVLLGSFGSWLETAIIVVILSRGKIVNISSLELSEADSVTSGY
jgi:predicted branched-subunit amino acid permease